MRPLRCGTKKGPPYLNKAIGELTNFCRSALVLYVACSFMLVCLRFDNHVAFLFHAAAREHQQLLYVRLHYLQYGMLVLLHSMLPRW